MKRILYSCFSAIFLLLFGTVKAQLGSYSIQPNPQCANASGIYTSQASMIAQVPAAVDYSWSVIAPNCQAGVTWTPVALGGIPGFPGAFTGVDITIPCEGPYTVVCTAYAINGASITEISDANDVLSGDYTYGMIFNSSNLPIFSNPVSGIICAGETVTLSTQLTPTTNAPFPLLPPPTYTWSSGGTGSTTAVAPTANTCYSVTSTISNNSPAGSCEITSAFCVSVQTQSLSISPSSQVICAGGITTMTASASSNSTGIVWSSGTVSPNQLVNTVNVPTTYTAVGTYTGIAGSCTTAATATVVLGTSVNITLTPSSPSVCPGTTFTLTANPSNAIANYSWTSGVTVQSAANTHTFTTTVPRTYTVNSTFSGNCPGTGSITIGILSLSPTLTASSPSICPNTAVTFTASGGVTYTFLALAAPPVTLTTIPPNTASHSPSSLPRQYTVLADSAGCKGTTTITVGEYSLNPTIAASSLSNCPNSTFTLSANPSQYSYTYTATSPSTNNISSSSIGSYSVTSSSAAFPATYTVAADSAGCKGTAAITIFSLNFTPTLTASSMSVCPNTTFALVAKGGNNYTVTLPTGANGVTIVPTRTVVSTASVFPATYTLTVDSAGCIGRQTTLTINSYTLNPRFGLALNTVSVCPTSVITFTAGSSNPSTPAGILTYTFYNGSTPPTTVIPHAPATGTTAQYTVPATFTSGTFSLTADSLGCKGGTTITLYRRTLEPILSLSSPSICANTSATITATGVGIGANTTYTFVRHQTNAAPTVTSIVQQSPAQPTVNYIIVTPSVATEYTVRVDSAGCTNLPIGGTSTVLLEMLPPLTPTIAYASSTVCAGQETTLSIQNQPTYTLTWVTLVGPTTVTLSTNTLVVVAPSVATTYSVHAIDPLGCIGTGTVNIGINPAPLLSLTTAVSPATICAGQSATMTVVGGSTYTWSPASAVAPANGSFVIGTPSVSTVYTVTGNNGYGCMGSTTLVTIVGQYPNLQILTPYAQVCAGFQTTLEAQGANSYTWTGTTFTTPINQTSIAVGPGTYTLTGSNGGSCIRDTVQIITPKNNLNITLSQSSPTTCIINNNPNKYSKPVHLVASGELGITTWFGPALTYTAGSETDAQPPASTCYTVQTVTANCSGSAAICVSVIPQFTMNVTPPLPIICAGDSIKLSIINISTLAVGAPSNFTYRWTEPEPGITNELMTPTVMVWPGTFPSALTSGPETWTVEVVDSRDCVSLPRLVTVTVLPRPETSVLIPTINLVPTNTICFVGNIPGAPNNLLTLLALNQNVNLPMGVTPTYTWMSPYDADHRSFISPATVNPVTIKAPLRLPAVVVYTVQSGYNGIPGCKRLDTVSIRVIDCRPVNNLNVKFTSDVQEICTRQCVSFMNLVDTAAGGPQEYYWQFPGGAPATSTLANPTVCYNLPGSRNVILYVTNPWTGQSSSTSSTSTGFTSKTAYIKVVDIPNVTIIPPGELKSDTVINFGQSVKLTGSGAVSYSWSPQYNISSISGPTTLVQPNQTTQYILTGYNNKNCFSSDTINVIVVEDRDCDKGMFIPNAFSPNGDGHNDKLYVRGVCLQSLTFMVFDRWGEKVFETNDQNVGWDGTFKGEPMNSGVFVYRLEGRTYNGKAYSLKGNITLIR